VDDVVHDFLAHHVDPLEHGLVQQPASGIGGLPVEGLSVSQQINQRNDCSRAVVNPSAWFGRALLQGLTAPSDIPKSSADLCGCQIAVSAQIEQVVLLHVELRQLPASLRLQESGRFILLANNRLDLSPNGATEVGRSGSK